MPKKIISLSEYEILYEHLERSEAMIAVDAAHVYGDVMAILYGEEWGKLKRIYDEGLTRVEDTADVYLCFDAIWQVFFSEEMPSFGEVDSHEINWNTVNMVIQKIARHILDAIYEIDGEHE